MLLSPIHFQITFSVTIRTTQPRLCSHNFRLFTSWSERWTLVLGGLGLGLTEWGYLAGGLCDGVKSLCLFQTCSEVRKMTSKNIVTILGFAATVRSSPPFPANNRLVGRVPCGCGGNACCRAPAPCRAGAINGGDRGVFPLRAVDLLTQARSVNRDWCHDPCLGTRR